MNLSIAVLCCLAVSVASDDGWDSWRKSGYGMKSWGKDRDGWNSWGKGGDGWKSWDKGGDGWMSWGKGDDGMKSWGKDGDGWMPWGKGGDDMKSWGKGGNGWMPWGKGDDGMKSWGKGGDGWMPWGKGGDDMKSWGKGGNGWMPWGKDDDGMKSWGKSGDGWMSWGKGGDRMKSWGKGGDGMKSWGKGGDGWMPWGKNSDDWMSWGKMGNDWMTKNKLWGNQGYGGEPGPRGFLMMMKRLHDRIRSRVFGRFSARGPFGGMGRSPPKQLDYVPSKNVISNEDKSEPAWHRTFRMLFGGDKSNSFEESGNDGRQGYSGYGYGDQAKPMGGRYGDNYSDKEIDNPILYIVKKIGEIFQEKVGGKDGKYEKNKDKSYNKNYGSDWEQGRGGYSNDKSAGGGYGNDDDKREWSQGNDNPARHVMRRLMEILLGKSDGSKSEGEYKDWGDKHSNEHGGDSMKGWEDDDKNKPEPMRRWGEGDGDRPGLMRRWGDDDRYGPGPMRRRGDDDEDRPRLMRRWGNDDEDRSGPMRRWGDNDEDRPRLMRRWGDDDGDRPGPMRRWRDDDGEKRDDDGHRPGSMRQWGYRNENGGSSEYGRGGNDMSQRRESRNTGYGESDNPMQNQMKKWMEMFFGDKKGSGTRTGESDDREYGNYSDKKDSGKKEYMNDFEDIMTKVMKMLKGTEEKGMKEHDSKKDENSCKKTCEAKGKCFGKQDFEKMMMTAPKSCKSCVMKKCDYKMDRKCFLDAHMACDDVCPKISPDKVKDKAETCKACMDMCEAEDHKTFIGDEDVGDEDGDEGTWPGQAEQNIDGDEEGINPNNVLSILDDLMSD